MAFLKRFFMVPTTLKTLKDWVNGLGARRETMHMGKRNYDNVGNALGYASKTSLPPISRCVLVVLM